MSTIELPISTDAAGIVSELTDSERADALGHAAAALVARASALILQRPRSSFSEAVNRRISEILAARDITPREMAQRLGWPLRRIERVTAGLSAFTVSELETLATALGMDVGALLSDVAAQS